MTNYLSLVGFSAYFALYTAVIAASHYLAPGTDLGPPLFWPAAGLLFATLLITKPKKAWIFALLGMAANILGNAFSDIPLGPNFFWIWPIPIAVMLIGVQLYKHFLSFYSRHSPERSVLFVIMGGVVTPALNAIASGLVYEWSGSGNILDTFRSHFVGSSLGILTVTPFITALHTMFLERNNPINWRVLAINIGILCGILLLSLQIFVFDVLPRTIHFELLVIPVLIAISLRGSNSLTASANLMISIFAFYRVIEDQTFLFAIAGDSNALNSVQFFVGVTTLTHLMLTAVVKKRLESARVLDEKSRELSVLNLELDAARREAMAASEAKSYFLANMSHEIRSPLSAMIGYADLITRPDEELSQKESYAHVIARNGQHLLELVNQILDLSKIEAGQFEVRVEPVLIKPLIDDVTEIMGKKARDKGLDFHVVWDGEIPTSIVIDDLRLKQILLNGLGNAIKFTDKGYVTLKISSPLDEHGHYRFTCRIEDTGIGLDENEQGRLFGAFQQANSEINRQYGGTGLGLELSRRLARLMAGDYQLLWSEKGRGSIFVLSIDGGPKVVRTEREEPKIPAVAHVRAPKLEGLSVLLVDDAADNRFLITRFLQLSGATVDSAENGKKAIERMAEESFDIVLMDIEMPEMNGIEATRILRERDYDGPVLALTGRAMPAEIEECLEAGFDGHLVKPVDRDLLIQSISEWARHGRSRAFLEVH